MSLIDGQTDDEVHAFILNVGANLKEEDFAFSVEVRGVKFDVYYFIARGKPGTIAFGKINGKFFIPMCCAKTLDPEDAIKEIEDEWELPH